MNVFKLIFSSSFIIYFCLSYSVLSQQTKFLQYSKKTIHSRAFIGDLIGTNIGEIYRWDFETDSFDLINPTNLFPEIRDIHSTLGNEIIAMQTGDKGAIVRIDKSGSINRIPFYEDNDKTKSIFLDGMSFEGNTGFLMGDPVNGYFSVYKSMDLGNTWTTCEGKIEAIEGEAAFAASGSTVHIIDGFFTFVSGGKASRYFKSADKGKTWEISAVPFPSCDACGAYSMCYLTEKLKKSTIQVSDINKIIIVGGDYTKPNESKNTCFYSLNGGKTWKKPRISPVGYRSSVIEVDRVLYCCGTNGVDYSIDFGKTWNSISNENCFALSSNETSILASTTNGRILVLKKITK